MAPILKSHCVSCHGSGKAGGGYDMATFEAMIHGGDTGENVQPGDAETSQLLELIRPGRNRGHR